MHLPAVLWVLLTATAPGAGDPPALDVQEASPAETAASALHVLVEDYGDWRHEQFPAEAIARGDERYADRVTDERLVAIEARHEARLAFLRRCLRIDRAVLGGRDLLDFDLLREHLDQDAKGHRFRAFLMPVGGRSGPHQAIPRMSEGVPFDDARDYRNYLDRLEQVPAMIDAIIDRLRRGMAEGRTPPRVTLAGVPGQFRTLLEGDALDVLAEPLASIPDAIPSDEAEAIRRRFREVARPGVIAALQRLGTFVTTTYLPACRDSIAATDLPDGEAFYAFRLRRMTTTDLDAEAIHAIGLAEVARIRAEMLDVIRRSDFMERRDGVAALDEDALFEAFVADLRTNPRFYHETPEALLAGYRDICKRIDEWMPRLFGRLPRLSYGVRAIPAFMAPNQTTAYYQYGSLYVGEPGWFYANTHDLSQRPRYEMIALALHEAVPGHHHQIALAQEMEDVPSFRSAIWFTAFGEGWALYSERLGLEMGLYEDPYDDFGRLTYEMWRACRLVVDPGLHALGWSRARAIEFMTANTALSDLNIATEVDRYIGWPGQATGYKIGELRIRALRERAEATLGEAFDLRAFHDAVLEAGSIPLTILDRRIDAWIARASASPAAE